MKKWLCVICGLIYDEAEGWPDDDIAPGTRWEDVPDDWTCPDCGVGKEDFEMIEMEGDEEAPAVSEPVAVAPVVAAAPAPAGTSAEAPIVIIGSGYAGYGLAEALRKRNADVRIVVFTQDDGADYSKPGLSNAMARGKTPDELVKATAEAMALRYGIEVKSGCQVLSIDADQHSITSEQGELGYYSKLVLATGADPVKLPLAGDGVADMLSVNSLTDYRVLRERLDSGAVRKVSIIGNGLVGCEYANELAAKGYEVSVVGLVHCLDAILPEIISHDLADRLAGLGVNWYLKNTVQSLDKSGAGYQLRLSGGETLEADLVLSCVGLRPRTALAMAAGIECKRGIVVDNTLQTSAPDIYALGDCSEIQGQILPYIAPITHGLKALPDTLSGTPTEVHYPAMPVVVKTPVLPLLILPAVPGTEGEWQIEDTGNGMRGLYRDDEQKVRGFALSGDVVNSERQQWLDAVNK